MYLRFFLPNSLSCCIGITWWFFKCSVKKSYRACPKKITFLRILRIESYLNIYDKAECRFTLLNFSKITYILSKLLYILVYDVNYVEYIYIYLIISDFDSIYVTYIKEIKTTNKNVCVYVYIANNRYMPCIYL